MKPLVAICIGHSRLINGKRDGGAVSATRVSEWEFNFDIGKRVAALLSKKKISGFILSAYPGNGYVDSMQKVARILKEKGACLAIELHFNSSDNLAAGGHEWLCWETSSNGERLAQCFNSEMQKDFTEIRFRGVKKLNAENRGGLFLNLTHCPAVICEPGFGSNAKEFYKLSSRKDDLAAVYANAIEKYLKK